MIDDNITNLFNDYYANIVKNLTRDNIAQNVKTYKP